MRRSPPLRRKLTFNSEAGFLLNDVATKVKGACNHQDFAGVGTAVPDRIGDYRIARLQSIGFNAWRMSHNPPNPELLRSADRRGLLVWDENRLFGDYTTWLQDMSSMVLRDRNHPSIIWWSLCNEYGCKQLADNSTLAAGQKFREIVKDLDTTRPISGAWSGSPVGLGMEWSDTVVDMFGQNVGARRRTAAPLRP